MEARLSLVASAQSCGQGVGGVHLHARAAKDSNASVAGGGGGCVRGTQRGGGGGTHLEQQNTTLTACGYFTRHFFARQGRSRPCNFAARETRPEWSWPCASLQSTTGSDEFASATGEKKCVGAS